MKIILTISIVLLFGCSSAPYALLDGERSLVVDPDNYDVYVVSVDDKLIFDKRRRLMLKPGSYRITLGSTRPQVSLGQPEYKEIILNAKPCMRYVLSAQHENNLSLADPSWEILVLDERIIKECARSMKNSEKISGS